MKSERLINSPFLAAMARLSGTSNERFSGPEMACRETVSSVFGSASLCQY